MSESLGTPPEWCWEKYARVCAAWRDSGKKTPKWTEFRRGGTMDWKRRVEAQTRHGQAGGTKGSLFLLSLPTFQTPVSELNEVPALALWLR
jgi:hypothetical protein